MGRPYLIESNYYCGELAPAEQTQLTRLLTSVVIRDQQRLSSHLPLAIRALDVLCAKRYLSKSSESAALLEQEFTDPANIEMWTQSGEMTEQQGGADFNQTWHYAAELSFILMQLGSDKAVSTREYLIRHADSEEFRKTLMEQPQSILFDRS